MSDSAEFARRVGSAAVAGWWTILIAALWLTAVWLAWLGLLAAEPGWVLKLWGGHDLTWADAQRMVLWFMAVFKIILWVALMVMIWLSLWSRRLKRAAAAG
jgi:hypothetical protein